jgi:hypothetical protein
MAELQNAMNRYGEAQIRMIQSMDSVRALGEKLLQGFEEYIGEPDCVCGVPPKGEWSPNRRDSAELSFDQEREPLWVGPISMGLALRIPHTKDEGVFWMRVMIEFAIEGNTWSVTVGGGKTIRLPIETAASDLLPVNEAIFDYVKSIFLNPVRSFEAQKAGQLGFVDFDGPSEDPMRR